jgi:hypothetical protein
MLLGFPRPLKKIPDQEGQGECPVNTHGMTAPRGAESSILPLSDAYGLKQFEIERGFRG